MKRRRQFGADFMIFSLILTGSFFPPYHLLTDVGFNLGYALASLQHLDGGVYIAMNGKVFAAHKCHKDIAAAQFVAS
ncbi:MAG: asparaginase [Candidatus Melainabacteria bacterium]|nr:asparaginase [Candidatus Melainabacteria bacterium]